MQYVTTTGQGDIDTQNKEQTLKLEDLKRNQEEQYAQLSTAAQNEYERMKTNTMLAKEQETEKFSADYKATMDSDQKSMDDLYTKANNQIRQIRQDTAQKLAAYGSRQSDPFYKMMDMNAELRDEGDRYVLTAQIPSHEQDHVSVALKGNTLILSGNRRNEEKLDLAPGKFKGTSSFQSFQESFPLAMPIERNALTKEFRGNQVVITVPKSMQASPHEGFQSKVPPPQRLRAERPHFPGNLPGVNEADSGTGSSAGAQKTPGEKKAERTLS